MNQMIEVPKADQPRSVLNDMAARFNMEPQAFEMTVRATCSPAPKRGEDFRPLTREEFAAFLLVAREYRLNPITREIFAYPKRGGGVVPIVSIDGWVNLINSHPACDGFKTIDRDGENGKPYSCTCIIYRKDRTHPTEVTEYFSECWRDTEPWKMAHRMLRHKAVIQCARYAFGFAGIYDEEEGQRIAEARVVSEPTQGPRPPRPTQTAAQPDQTAAKADPITMRQDEANIIDAESEVIGGVDGDKQLANLAFIDDLRDRLFEAKDPVTLEEIWTEYDPMARLEGSPDDQDMCQRLKARLLRQLGAKEE